MEHVPWALTFDYNILVDKHLQLYSNKTGVIWIDIYGEKKKNHLQYQNTAYTSEREGRIWKEETTELSHNNSKQPKCHILEKYKNLHLFGSIIFEALSSIQFFIFPKNRKNHRMDLNQLTWHTRELWKCILSKSHINHNDRPLKCVKWQRLSPYKIPSITRSINTNECKSKPLDF